MAKDKKTARTRTLWTRRDAMSRSGWVMVLSSIGIGLVGSVRLLFPRVHHREPTTVVLGKADDFTVGEVNIKWKKSHSLIVVRTAQGFYALRSICTHLGCIPNWKPAEEKFKCPCHGSGFHKDGINFEGPAPRPLERLKIVLDNKGMLVVDTAVRFRQEKGEWAQGESFVRYSSKGRRV